MSQDSSSPENDSPRTILVTGSNGGIGLAIARAFFEEDPGNFVFLGVRERRDHATALLEEFAGRGALLPLEVSSREAWDAAISTISDRTGRLDVLVNNAGQNEDMLLAQMPSEVWQNTLDTNLNSVFYGCRAALPLMIGQRHGRIVNIASLSALLAPAGQTNYAAAKAGVVAMTQSLAKEVARIGITVNAVCPGYIRSEITTQDDPVAQKELARKIPMRRLGEPHEVAAAVRFLACNQASYITGSTLKIDGGIM